MRDKLGKILAQLNAAIEQDEFSLTKSENALAEWQSALEQAEHETSALDPAALNQEQSRVAVERAAWQQRVTAAESIGVSELGANIAEARAALAALEPADKLERIQANLEPSVKETRQLRDKMEANRHRQQQLEQRLAELQQEETTLQAQIERLEYAKVEWQKKQETRKLRQDCLTLAENIHALETKWRAQIR
ncbi:MAG: hypothetical protein B6D41_22070 [Chloroflexi bacterium UTCFX4]|jgi:chromosome segregation ATPase|nr:MAG: hypothetical protein B6D41_22070 [Chloroflexi bacterium UTCFX4]